MAYTHSRLRKTLALVRIGVGLLLVHSGFYKVSSITFARVDFQDFLFSAISSTAVDFYGKFLTAYILPYGTRVAIALGFFELFLGISLILGLLTRPVCILGMLYQINFVLATWWQPGPGEPLWHYPDEQLRYVFPFFIFLILGIGHAGENWGLGSLYHGRRHERWEKRWEVKVVPGLPAETVSPAKKEVASAAASAPPAGEPKKPN
jgi:uncharacterized membrane protein YphA (DoxX/SURF4 family)